MPTFPAADATTLFLAVLGRKENKTQKTISQDTKNERDSGALEKKISHSLKVIEHLILKAKNFERETWARTR